MFVRLSAGLALPPAVCKNALVMTEVPGLGMFSLSLLGCDIGILGAIFCVSSRFLGSNGT